MTQPFDGLLDRFALASAGFERLLRTVRPEQREWPTPRTDWNVRQLVNHMTGGNLNYTSVARGGSAEDTTHRFFAAPGGRLPDGASRQAWLLHRMGRTTGAPYPAG